MYKRINKLSFLILLGCIFLLCSCGKEPYDNENLEEQIVEEDVNGNGTLDYIRLFEDQGHYYTEICVDEKMIVLDNGGIDWSAGGGLEKFEAIDIDNDGETEYLTMINTGGSGGLGSCLLYFLDVKNGKLEEMDFPSYIDPLADGTEELVKGYAFEVTVEAQSPYDYTFIYDNDIQDKGNWEALFDEVYQGWPDGEEMYLQDVKDWDEGNGTSLFGQNARGFSGYVVEKREEGMVVWFPESIRSNFSCIMSPGIVWYGLSWKEDGSYTLVDKVFERISTEEDYWTEKGAIDASEIGFLQKVAEDEILDMALEYRLRHGMYIPEFADTSTNEFGLVVIQFYDVVIDDPETGEGHTATSDWFYIDPDTKRGEDLFGTPIDLMN